MKFNSYDGIKKIFAASSLGLFAAISTTNTSAQEQTFFEGFEGGIPSEWTEIEPVALSRVEFAGENSAQINEGGSLTRTFNVEPNTDYTLRVMVRGGGRMRVRWDGANRSTRVTNPSNEYIERTIEFNSANATTADISFEFNSEEGRFDNFTIESAGSSSSSSVVRLQKRNTQFSFDGRNGAQVGVQSHLWNTDASNVNQQWVEIDRGNGYYSYQKQGTNVCIDGGNGGARRQPVIMFTCNDTNRNQHWLKVGTAGNSYRLEKRNAPGYSIDGNNGAARRQVIYLWDSNSNNINQQWEFLNSSTPVVVAPVTPTPVEPTPVTPTPVEPTPVTPIPVEPTPVGSFGLNPNLEPWENFDLSDWALDAPNPDPEDGLSARTTDIDFGRGELFPGSEPYFFTGSDGAMVFRSNVGGRRTSSNTSFPRSELREMLRAGNGDVSTQGVNENNWVLGYQPNDLDLGAHTTGAQENTPTRVGGRGGVLTSTMRVNRVTETGSSSQVGRVIIGQIHADNDEPLRLYYRKLPNNDLGSVYFTHEIRDDDDLDDVNLVGSSSSSASNPSDGIALGQLFSYEIINEGSVIEVILRDGDRDGPIIGRGSFEMEEENSNYDRDDEWMYFKAGAYTQNNSGNDSDFDEVAIYRLENTH